MATCRHPACTAEAVQDGGMCRACSWWVDTSGYDPTREMGRSNCPACTWPPDPDA